MIDHRHHGKDLGDTDAEIAHEIDELPIHVWFTSVHKWAENVPGAWIKKFGHIYTKYVKQYTSDHFRNAVVGWWNRDFLCDDEQARTEQLKAEHNAWLLRHRK